MIKRPQLKQALTTLCDNSWRLFDHAEQAWVGISLQISLLEWTGCSKKENMAGAESEGGSGKEFSVLFHFPGVGGSYSLGSRLECRFVGYTVLNER
jgi:hypothetical protein